MNYKVVMSFSREVIITSDQADKLKEFLVGGLGTFVMIGDLMVQTKDIRMIEPTKDKTPEQLKEAEGQIALEAAKYQENTVAASKWGAFAENWMNAKFGKGKWSVRQKIKHLQEIKSAYIDHEQT